MEALKYYGNRNVGVQEISLPIPVVGQILLEVKVSALCGSERADYEKGFSGIPGHEFCGTVKDVSAYSYLKKGDRVTVCAVKGCGQCSFCHMGQPQFCNAMTVINGGHAEYAVVPEECCILLPDEMDFETGVLLGGDTLGVAYRAIQKIKTCTTRHAAVSGAGPIGIGVISLLKYYGFHVTVWEPNESRRAFAVNVLKADQAEENGELFQGKAELIFECSGNPAAQRYALECVRPGGQVIFCGENYRELQIIPSEHIIHKEVLLTGAFYFTKQDFYELCSIWKRGFDPRMAVSHKFTLREGKTACKLFFEGETAKTLFVHETGSTV